MARSSTLCLPLPKIKFRISMAKRKSFATGGEAKKRRHVRRATERESSDPITLSTSAKFKYAWKKLRKAGWTLKSPSSRSLDSRYRYSRPESDPRGTEGEDFLLGEASVVKYVSEQNQLQLPVNDAMLIQVVENAITPARAIHMAVMLTGDEDKVMAVHGTALAAAGVPTTALGAVDNMAAPAKTDNIALVLDRDAASAVVVHVVALVVTTVQDLRIAVVQKWCDESEEVVIEDVSDLQEVGVYDAYYPMVLLPTSLVEVKFAKQVPYKSNAYTVAYDIEISQPFTITEFMKSLGIMVFMTLNKKGDNIEDRWLFKVQNELYMVENMAAPTKTKNVALVMVVNEANVVPLSVTDLFVTGDCIVVL
ncbi:hypothetical protein PInf_017505 [Phytophthora infestans]|nr:hypothetical protein PInf_017505 [Phytophthora infestans]